MKILIAPDSFKGTLSAKQVCEIVSKTLLRRFPQAEILQIPIADGGEGTTEAYLHLFGGELRQIAAKSPLGRTIEATYGILPNGVAVIETAAASGISIEAQNNALLASSFGTGQLVADAINRGCKTILLGLGGSATTDGGTGFAAALGARFLNANGEDLPHGGGALEAIETIDLSRMRERLAGIELRVLCDVKNPLFGPQGAAAVYAPQKGANEADVERLDRGLRKLAAVCAETIGADFANCPGAGAAGGLGFACMAFAGAKLIGGIDAILDAAQFEEKAKTADLVITGEGKMDAQSLMGKAPFGVAKRSGKTKVIAVVGLLDADMETVRKAGISEVYETNDRHLPFEQVKDRAAEDLARAAERIKI